MENVLTVPMPSLLAQMEYLTFEVNVIMLDSACFWHISVVEVSDEHIWKVL